MNEYTYIYIYEQIYIYIYMYTTYKTIDDMWLWPKSILRPLDHGGLGGRSGQQPLQGFVVLGGGDGVVLQQRGENPRQIQVKKAPVNQGVPPCKSSLCKKKRICLGKICHHTLPHRFTRLGMMYLRTDLQLYT